MGGSGGLRCLGGADKSLQCRTCSPGEPLLPPPVTVSRHFRARWHVCCSHLSHFPGISVPGGGFAASTWRTFPAFPCPVACLLPPPVTVSPHSRARWRFRCSHLSHFPGLPVPGGMFVPHTWRTFPAFPCPVAFLSPSSRNAVSHRVSGPAVWRPRRALPRD